MDNELARLGQQNGLSRRDRRQTQRLQNVYDEVRLRGLQVDGAIALGGHIMEGVEALDARRHSLANGDMQMAMLLADIESNTIRQVKGIQASLFNDWGL